MPVFPCFTVTRLWQRSCTIQGYSPLTPEVRWPALLCLNEPRRPLTSYPIQQGSRGMTGLLKDARFALRQLRRSSGFTAVAILTLAFGIGATTAIFSIVEGVLLRPLPFPNPDRLVALGDVPEGVDLGSGAPGVTAPRHGRSMRGTRASSPDWARISRPALNFPAPEIQHRSTPRGLLPVLSRCSAFRQ